jgi:predicted DsbA family dithiol-disulfide isomerase
VQEPYELLRSTRRHGHRGVDRQEEEDADSEELEEEIEEAEAEAAEAGKQKYRDRRGSRRKAGHGCAAPKLINLATQLGKGWHRANHRLQQLIVDEVWC